MRFPRLTFFAVAAAGSLAFRLLASAAVEMTETPDKVRVEIGGKLLTEYCFTGAPHVYFFPLLGPGGEKMTRDWPMKDSPGEEHDHPHHRSLWFAHGAVNGVDFWTEPETHAASKEVPTGKIEHEKFLEVQGGETSGVIRDQLRWIAPDGSVPLTSVQTFRALEGAANERVIDFEMALTAGEKDVIFGDTKEGTMAIRIAESMRLKAAKGAAKPGEGHIVNDAGDRDDKVWGKRATWVDMSGPVEGKIVGIAMFDHPKNPRHPTRWHARDYGLFAANPFCENEMDKTLPKGAGDFKLEAGKTATFRYRIILHEGDATAAKVAEKFATWAGGK